MNKQKHEEVIVKTYYEKIGDIVYVWRKIGKGEWERIETPYKEEPVIYYGLS